MTDAHLFLYILLPLAAAVAAFLVYTQVIQPKQERAAQTACVCGPTPHPGMSMDPNDAYIGPVLAASLGGNHSQGVPLHPSVDKDGNLYVDLPHEGEGKLDYILTHHGPLTDFDELHLWWRLDADPGAEAIAVPEPGTSPASTYQARITPVIVEDGEDWQADGQFEDYRNFHEDADLDYLTPGERTMVVDLHTGWTGVLTSTEQNNPEGFKKLIDNACCLGFVLGGNDTGIGHGAAVRGGNARLTWRWQTVKRP